MDIPSWARVPNNDARVEQPVDSDYTDESGTDDGDYPLGIGGDPTRTPLTWIPHTHDVPLDDGDDAHTGRAAVCYDESTLRFFQGIAFLTAAVATLMGGANGFVAIAHPGSLKVVVVVWTDPHGSVTYYPAILAPNNLPTTPWKRKARCGFIRSYSALWSWLSS